MPTASLDSYGGKQMLSLGLSGDFTDTEGYPTVALIDWGIPIVDEAALRAALGILGSTPQGYRVDDDVLKGAFLDLAASWDWVASTWTLDTAEISEMHRGRAWDHTAMLRMLMHWIDRNGGRQHQLFIAADSVAAMRAAVQARPTQVFQDVTGRQRVGSREDSQPNAVLLVADYAAGLRADMLAGDSDAEYRWHVSVRPHFASGVVWPERVNDS